MVHHTAALTKFHHDLTVTFNYKCGLWLYFINFLTSLAIWEFSLIVFLTDSTSLSLTIWSHSTLSSSKCIKHSWRGQSSWEVHIILEGLRANVLFCFKKQILNLTQMSCVIIIFARAIITGCILSPICHLLSCKLRWSLKCFAIILPVSCQIM